MAFCDSKIWQISLVKGNVVERIPFVLTINNGEITGDVMSIENTPRRISRIRGRCQSISRPGLPDLAFMHFIFRFKRGGNERGVMMAGFAFVPEAGGVPEFIGGFRVFPAHIDLPAAGEGEFVTLQVDTGDTGTGSGQQT